MGDNFGLNELRSRVINRGLCAACGACIDTCPYITAFRGRTIPLENCTLDRGRCFSYCPMAFFDPEGTAKAIFDSPYAAEGVGNAIQVLASRAADSSVSDAGQGGGTVTALMISALRNDIIDAAVLTGVPTGELFPCGLVATSEEEIRSCAGSLFVGAHSLAAFRKAIDAGHRRVAIAGLPCQVRAVRKMAQLDILGEGLAHRVGPIIGLFCNWAFSAREFMDFLAKRYDLSTVRGYQIPPPPADSFLVHTEKGTEAFPLDELRPMIQAACNVCPDMTSEFADLSVGMYEGREGWNTLIIRTEKGRRLLRMAEDRGMIITDTFPQANLEHLEGACDKKRARPSQA